MSVNWNVTGAIALVASLVVATSAEATVLTMQGDVSANANASPPPAGGNTYGPLGNGSTLVSEYGDFVSGPTQTDVPTADFGSPPYWYNFTYGNNGEGFTPNVAVAKQIRYSTVFNTATRTQTSYGNLPLVSYPATGFTGGGNWYWTFTADPSFNVRLLSTDLVRFNSTVLNATVNVYTGNDPASLGAPLYSSGPTAVGNVGVTFSPNVAANSLTLEFQLPAGEAMFNWAADNIVFSQSRVPEPATGAMAATALLLGAIIRRRRAA